MQTFLKSALLVALVLMGNIADAREGSLKVEQSPAIENLLNQHIDYNATHAISGYRIRIYRNNDANARQEAQEARGQFLQLYPDVSAYLTYDNPYFKVAVGDFRTRDEALALFNKIKSVFPKAFIITEYIRFPPLQKGEANDDNDD